MWRIKLRWKLLRLPPMCIEKSTGVVLSAKLTKYIGIFTNRIHQTEWCRVFIYVEISSKWNSSYIVFQDHESPHKPIKGIRIQKLQTDEDLKIRKQSLQGHKPKVELNGIVTPIYKTIKGESQLGWYTFISVTANPPLRLETAIPYIYDVRAKLKRRWRSKEWDKWLYKWEK